MPNPFKGLVDVGDAVAPAAKENSCKFAPAAEKIFVKRANTPETDSHSVRNIGANVLRMEGLRGKVSVNISWLAKESGMPLILVKEHLYVQKSSRGTPRTNLYLYLVACLCRESVESRHKFIERLTAT